ncbi:DUF6141 family protein [Candidatus Chlorohelix sp.]|uniref:DUF6141 family protein n=1 Tax=Candidatus Chlorohelix sp. TaxID=3139201 RepID=UPI00304BC6B8
MASNIKTGDNPVKFCEVQRFMQWWIWLLLGAIAAMMWVMAFVQMVLGIKFGSKPVPDFILVALWLIFGIAFPYFFLSNRLIIEVRGDGIYYRFTSLQFRFRQVQFDELAAAQLRQYHPLREYGGWGIRLGKGSIAYNVTGNRGVLLELVNGKKILLGSQQPEKLLQAIEQGRKG